MEKGSRNRRKPESEAISLYATLQEPEFRCFTLNSSVVGLEVRFAWCVWVFKVLVLCMFGCYVQVRV